MKGFLKFLLSLCVIVSAMVASVIVKIEPTASDAEVLAMIHREDDVYQSTTSVTVTDELAFQTFEDVEETTSSSSTTTTANTTTVNTTSTTTHTTHTTQTTACSHSDTVTKHTASTCTKTGKTITSCRYCGIKIEEKIIDKIPHKQKTVTKDSTCSSSGEIKTYCTVCDVVLKRETIATKSHTLKTIKDTPATPFGNGYKEWYCEICHISYPVTVIFCPKGDIDLYAPSAGIHCEVFMGECNQKNTDNHDVSCDVNFIDNNNPLFFGHNTRSLKNLSKLKIGDLIYFTVNGKTSVYRVTVSEKASTINSGTNIEGWDTDTLVLDPCENETLHFFTCYYHPMYTANRWIVLAEKIENYKP